MTKPTKKSTTPNGARDCTSSEPRTPVVLFEEPDTVFFEPRQLDGRYAYRPTLRRMPIDDNNALPIELYDADEQFDDTDIEMGETSLAILNRS